ncbi:hypothetical protein P780_08720 [Vibrio mimicus CAIM 1882]|nr:hypothetical protein P780_08720 [Vibrio mimicus CAIM 1882]
MDVMGWAGTQQRYAVAWTGDQYTNGITFVGIYLLLSVQVCLVRPTPLQT